jgi:hypothetical protein
MTTQEKPVQEQQAMRKAVAAFRKYYKDELWPFKDDLAMYNKGSK